MTIKLSPKQTLVLWHLLITGEEPAISKVRPELTPQERKPLLDGGLIDLVQRGRTKHMVLTDKAWAWASAQPVTALPAAKDPTLLLTLITKVQQYIQTQDISLAEFLAPQPAAMENSETSEAQGLLPTLTDTLADQIQVATGTLTDQIQAAYQSITQGKWNVRVRLADLRKSLPHSPKEAIDAALRQMQLNGQSVLMPLDDPKGIHAEDEQAAVNIGGDLRHIVYLKG